MSIVHVGVTLDCADLERLAAFWSTALDLEPELVGDYALLRGRSARSGLQGLTLQRVPETKVVKNRMHLDLVTPDVGVEVERLIQLGATVLARETEPTPEQTVVMGDPEGNEFCVIKEHVAP